MNQSFILLALFFCHFLADYTHLSTNGMLQAKRLGAPLFPILVHAWVHAVLMGIVLFLFGITNPIRGVLILFQLVTHFIIDVWKGKMNAWFPALQSPVNKWHWVIFGFDQLLHAIVIIIMSHFCSHYA